MRRLFRFVLFCAALLSAGAAPAAAPFRVEKTASNERGIRGEFPGGGELVVLSGAPREMGEAFGELFEPEIKIMASRVLVAAAVYAVGKEDWFFTRIGEVMERSGKYIPPRFLAECDAMSARAGLGMREGRHLNFFPELFHCSGVAVRGTASLNGEVIHARVLDYMRDLALYDLAVAQVYLPEGHYAWAGIGYAGFIGTVTAINEHGLAMGELGGGGYGNWDGIPMNFLMRRVMEECRNVREAVKLMKSVPLTCEYYYVLSDASGDMTAAHAKAGPGGELSFLAPGAPHEKLLTPPPDTVYLSGGKRAKALHERLVGQYGKITPEVMIEMIKRPVAMRSNLHNAIFLPAKREILFANASKDKIAAEMPYTKFSLPEVIREYRRLAAAREGKEKQK